MNIKKTPKADLEGKRTIFIQVGLITALCIVWLAFEWKTYDRSLVDLGEQEVVLLDEELMVQTERVEPPPPPPPEEQTILEIVDDDTEVETELEINVEADQRTEVQAYVPVQIDEPEVEEAEIFFVVEESPEFPGGEDAMRRFLAENIRYPQMARESGIQGTVFVTFVVEPNGNVSGVRVLRGIGGGCDEEALRVVNLMPKWKPGRQRNRAVRVQFNMPIRFVLAGS